MTGPKGTSRRSFLTTSAAAGGALAGGLGFVPLVHGQADKPIKVGLVGCGGRGRGAAENICEAAGTTYPIKLHALGDVFEDRAKDCMEFLKKNEKVQGKLDVAPERMFTGFDAYQKVIDSCDLVMFATPPGFRPGHIEAAVKAGKNIFSEKPVAVDATGIRKVLAAAEEAEKKGLSIVAGTQRRHQAGYIESMKRIHEGAIGKVTSACVYWNQGNIWANKRQEGMTDMEYQLRNWYHFVWLCGDHIVEQHVHNLDVACWAIGSPPVRAVAMGGRAANFGPEYGESFDHFAVDYEFPDGVHVLSMARQIAGCESNVSEYIVGTKGTWSSGGYRFVTADDRERIRGDGINPYVQEHIDLLESIQSGKPINEGKQVAHSTMVAIMGRMSAYTGKAVTWEQALNSKLDTFPKSLDWKAPLKENPVAIPGQTELI